MWKTGISACLAVGHFFHPNRFSGCAVLQTCSVECLHIHYTHTNFIIIYYIIQVWWMNIEQPRFTKFTHDFFVLILLLSPRIDRKEKNCNLEFCICYIFYIRSWLGWPTLLEIILKRMFLWVLTHIVCVPMTIYLYIIYFSMFCM